jgi:hypothetical protein
MYPSTIDISYETDEEYQQAFLSLFDLKEWDGDIISKSLDELYLKIKDVPELKEKMKMAAGAILSEDMEMGLRILFSYDNFKEWHKTLNFNL